MVSDLNPSNKDALFETWDDAGKGHAKNVMEQVVSVCTSYDPFSRPPILDTYNHAKV